VTTAFNANYPVILQRIRTAAGPDTIIIAMAFYNPFSGTGQAVDGPGDLVAGQITAQAKAVATTAPVNAVWVDLFALLQGKGPQLTHINDAQSDIHPTDAGHAAIADAMFAALKAATAGPATPAPPATGSGPLGDGEYGLLWVSVVVLIGAALSIALAGSSRR
jgi:lysophospholipase L1-like esterase